MYRFDYHKASSLEDATARLGTTGDSLALAGGMTLIPTLKQRLAMPDLLVDLAGIAGLAEIDEDGGQLRIGAMATHRAVAESAVVGRAIPALGRLAGGIGDPAVRERGTIGGSVANNDPAADWPAALLALGATVATTAREIAADEFFLGLFETALEPGELIYRIDFPLPRRAGWAKFPNPASRYAIVGVFVAETAAGVRVAVTGAGPGVFRQPELEAALAGNFHPDAVAGIAVPPDGLNRDLHATAEYRARLVTVMTRRAVKDALGEG